MQLSDRASDNTRFPAQWAPFWKSISKILQVLFWGTHSWIPGKMLCIQRSETSQPTFIGPRPNKKFWLWQTQRFLVSLFLNLQFGQRFTCVWRALWDFWSAVIARQTPNLKVVENIVKHNMNVGTTKSKRIDRCSSKPTIRPRAWFDWKLRYPSK